MTKKLSLRAMPAAFALLPILAVLAAPPRATAQGPAWPPIETADSKMKDCPQQPGAPAVILYREEITDVTTRTTTVFRRLKILTAAGLDRANIEIPFIAGYTDIDKIEARVVPPEGPAREFGGQIFEKTAIRVRKMRVAVKTFALPDVEVGSIIDYRYEVKHRKSGSSAKEELDELMTGLGEQEARPEEGGFTERKEPRAIAIGRWQVQENLFTKKAKFSYTNKITLIQFLLGGGWRLAWASVGMPTGAPKIGLGSADLEISDIPAFDAEDYMIPEEMLRMSVDLFYFDGEVKNGDEFWKLESADWQKGVEGFIGKPAKLEGRARGIVGDATEPLDRLKRIYESVQGLRHLSYEKGLTRAQRKERKIKDNRSVLDVLERGYGLRSDVTRTFVALAQAAGFAAEVIRVAARDNKLFRKDFLSFSDQLDSELALVEVGGRKYLLDPATPFCPFGLAHWSRTNTTAVRFSDAPPAFFTTPYFPPDMALTQREVALDLEPGGGLRGSVKTTYTGQEALVRRLDNLGGDDTARKEALEKEMTDILPAGSAATLTKVEDFDSSSPALIAHYDVVIPGLGTSAGDKTLLPVSPLLGPGRYPFRHAERRHSVFFPYPFREFDDIVITLPEGLAVEVRPEPRKNQDDFSSYSLACALEAPNKLHVQRDLAIKKVFHPVERYTALKAFFDTVRTIDEEQIVLARVPGVRLTERPH